MIEKTEYDSLTRYTKNGNPHRFEGPSLIWKYGDLAYCTKGKPHRIEGPAVVWDNDEGEYWVNGIKYNKDLFETKYKPCVLRNGILK